MELSDIINKISDTAWALSQNRHVLLLGYLKFGRIGLNTKIVTGDIIIS